MLLIPPALEFLNSSVFFLSFIIDSVMNLKFMLLRCGCGLGDWTL